MNLQIDYLRTFIAVADTRGFTKAGRQVNRSQSAVSMQIKRLEDEVGRPEFERIGKTVKLTTEGSLLIKYARRMVKEHDDAVMALSKPALKGFIRFGSPEHYTAGVLPKLLARFANHQHRFVALVCRFHDAAVLFQQTVGVFANLLIGIDNHQPVWLVMPRGCQ